MIASDVEAKSTALFLQTKHTDVLLGDWTAERVSTVSSVRCVGLSEGKAVGYRPLKVSMRTLKARSRGP